MSLPLLGYEFDSKQSFCFLAYKMSSARYLRLL